MASHGVNSPLLPKDNKFLIIKEMIRLTVHKLLSPISGKWLEDHWTLDLAEIIDSCRVCVIEVFHYVGWAVTLSFICFRNIFYSSEFFCNCTKLTL